jgi:predicted ATPase
VGRPAPTSARLLDRDRELREIRERLDAARAGTGSALVVEGPGGIGKTELLLAAEHEARERDMCVVSARGAELEREFAFGVVRQLFEARVHGPGGGELMDGAAALGAPVFELVGHGEEDERSFAVLHGLYWLCASLADRAPLVVLVDDAHWSDPASLAFLAYLARRVEDLPVALAVASRPGVEEIEEGLLAQSRAVRVRPAPLTRAAVGALLVADTGESPDEAFVSACLSATEGNPFLVRELVRELGERGMGSSAEDAERVRELGPRTVARRLLARLGRASPVSVEVVRAVAVLGADADVRRIARLTELPPEDVTAALDALVAADVLAGGRPVGFVHPIARSAIYAAIPAGERAGMHSLAAALLREEGAPTERIASHVLLTEPAGDAASVEFLVAAARGALARGAPSSAASYLRRALSEPPDPGERPALLAELGSAESLVGDARAIGHLREALDGRATARCARPRRSRWPVSWCCRARRAKRLRSSSRPPRAPSAGRCGWRPRPCRRGSATSRRRR